MLLVLAVLPGQAQQGWLYVAVFLVGIGRSVFEATLSAATPVLAGERTQLMNSVLAGLKGIAFMVGMGLSAVVVPLVGFRGVFLLDAGSYALSALVLLAIRVRFRESVEPGREVVRRPVVWPAVVAAGLVPLLVVRCLDAFGSSSQHVGIPILGSELDPGAPTRAAGCAVERVGGRPAVGQLCVAAVGNQDHYPGSRGGVLPGDDGHVGRVHRHFLGRRLVVAVSGGRGGRGGRRVQ